MRVTHAKVSAEGPATDPADVGGDDWNDDHIIEDLEADDVGLGAFAGLTPATLPVSTATASAISTAVAALVDASPGTLDTLNELAAALGDDPNFATTVTNAIAGKEPTIAAGTTAQYRRGDKTWQDFFTSVRAATLTGLSTATATAVAAADTVLVGMGKLQAQVSALFVLGPQTGDFKFVMRAAAPTGWIVGNGSTIGNVGSGATRANVDTLALFTAWWAEYTDAQLPILTSAGGASTRGASAAADWAALKRLTVFDVQDRVPRASGSVQGNGLKLEPSAVYDNFGNGASVQAPYNNSVQNSEGVLGVSMKYANVTTTDSGPGVLAFAKVRVASIGMLGCFKL